jgi:hypothetical protein
MLFCHMDDIEPNLDALFVQALIKPGDVFGVHVHGTDPFTPTGPRVRFFMVFLLWLAQLWGCVPFQEPAVNSERCDV